MTDQVERIDITEFRELGFLQEANRLFFHPLGLALETVVQEDGSETLGGIWDYRGDPEGVMFGNDVLTQEKADNVLDEGSKHFEARKELLGGMIQHVGWELKD